MRWAGTFKVRPHKFPDETGTSVFGAKAIRINRTISNDDRNLPTSSCSRYDWREHCDLRAGFRASDQTTDTTRNRFRVIRAYRKIWLSNHRTKVTLSRCHVPFNIIRIRIRRKTSAGREHDLSSEKSSDIDRIPEPLLKTVDAFVVSTSNNANSRKSSWCVFNLHAWPTEPTYVIREVARSYVVADLSCTPINGSHYSSSLSAIVRVLKRKNKTVWGQPVPFLHLPASPLPKQACRLAFIMHMYLLLMSSIWRFLEKFSGFYEEKWGCTPLIDMDLLFT